MEIGYIKTLYKDALPEGQIPSMEKLIEAFEQGDKADPYLIAYLKHRPEVVSLIRMVISDSIPPLQQYCMVTLAENTKLKQELTDAAYQNLREFVDRVEKDTQKKTVIAKLASPETVIRDCARVAMAKKLMQLTGE